MKTHSIPNRPEGNVLVICLLTCALIAFAIASCFALVRSQLVAAARSQGWNESLVISEAGIEDGLTLINRYSGTSIARGVWADTYADGNWYLIPGTNPKVFWVQRTMNGSLYDAYVTNNADGQPTIRSVGTKQFSGGASLRRAIVVKAAPASLFQGGLIAKGGVSLQGTVLVDSFNSQKAGMNTNGLYDPLYRNDNGNIATASSNVTATVSVGGSVEVYGKIFTGPEDAIVYSGTVAIGSESYVDGSGTGLQTGASQNDLNVYIPDAPAAPTGGIPLPTKTTYSFQGTNVPNSYLLTGASGGTYQTANVNLASTEKILIQGNVKLYVSANFRMSGQSQVVIGPNSSLTLYSGGSIDLSGGGVINQTGFATNLTVNGLPSCRTIQYTGGSDFIGTIYAPQADFTMSGGGNTIYNLIGAAVASTITLNGKYQVHYDESLIELPVGPHYYVSSWKEITL